MGPQLFLLYTTEPFTIMENKLYGYAGDATLVVVVPSPTEGVAVTESYRVSKWCDLRGNVIEREKN